MQRLKICVSGASGMVGYHLVKRFLASGHEVHAMVRPQSDTQDLEQLSSPSGNKAHLIKVDLSQPSQLEQALSGIDVYIHAAGLVDPLANRKMIFAVNVEGTRSALKAALSCGVKQFIHISSLSVITGQHDQYNVDEETPLIYCGEPYADSKVDAEKAVTEAFNQERMMATILRPGFIYGPRERAWMPRLITNLKNKKAMLIDGGRKECNLIYVENLSTAVELSLLNKDADKQIFNLTDGESITKKVLFDTICDCMGFTRITKKVPSWLARPVCEIISAISSFLPESERRKLSRFSRAAYRLAGINQGFNINKAVLRLHYTNRIPFASGMKSSLEYFHNKPSGHECKMASGRGNC